MSDPQSPPPPPPMSGCALVLLGLVGVVLLLPGLCSLIVIGIGLSDGSLGRHLNDVIGFFLMSFVAAAGGFFLIRFVFRGGR
jgi:hypothetical protein